MNSFLLKLSIVLCFAPHLLQAMDGVNHQNQVIEQAEIRASQRSSNSLDSAVTLYEELLNSPNALKPVYKVLLNSDLDFIVAAGAFYDPTQPDLFFKRLNENKCNWQSIYKNINELSYAQQRLQKALASCNKRDLLIARNESIKKVLRLSVAAFLLLDVFMYAPPLRHIGLDVVNFIIILTPLLFKKIGEFVFPQLKNNAFYFYPAKILAYMLYCLLAYIGFCHIVALLQKLLAVEKIERALLAHEKCSMQLGHATELKENYVKALTSIRERDNLFANPSAQYFMSRLPEDVRREIRNYFYYRPAIQQAEQEATHE